MPRIWADTIDTHRRQVTDAVLDATAGLVEEAGPMSVTMSAIAARAGIGRATLYKYFADVESILVAWHHRQFDDRLSQLAALAGSGVGTLDELIGWALHQRRHLRDHHHSSIVGTLAEALAAPGSGMPDAVERSVVHALRDVVSDLAQRGEARHDVDPETLARWLLHGIHAPASIGDDAVAAVLATSLAPPTSSSVASASSRRRPR